MAQAAQTTQNEWDAEGNIFDFTDAATGITCAMRRGPMGHWCGYAAVSAGTPLHGLGYSSSVLAPDAFLNRSMKVDEDYSAISLFCASLNSDIENKLLPLELLLRCHGGLTFTGKAKYLPDAGDAWWFGFDCAHSGDLVPQMSGHGGDVYRNEAYVRASLTKLCGDISELTKAMQH